MIGCVVEKTCRVSDVIGQAPLVMVQTNSFHPLATIVAIVEALVGLAIIPL